MPPTTDERESALRASLFGFLQYKTQGMNSSLDIAGALASALVLVHGMISEFATASNRAHLSPVWRRLPAELKLETVRWLPRGQCAKMLGVSRDVRALLLSDTSLWTTISIPRIRLDKTDCAQFIQTMVTRSGCRPVDLDWIRECVNPSNNPDAARDIVLSVLPRVRTLVLHPSYFQAGPPSFWTVPTPLLQKLTVSNGTGTRPYFTLQSSWPAKDTPLFRDLKLETRTFFDAPPLQPFQSVVHLELTMGCPSGGDCWNHLWAWFPRLVRLLLHVDESGEPPSIPSPPDSVRHVTLLGGDNCKSPERVVRNWVAPRVQKLEIFSSEKMAVHNAAEYLKRSDPGSWTVYVVSSCCPERHSWASTIFRGQHQTVVVRSTVNHNQCPQLGEALERATLGGMLYELVLSGPPICTIFDDGVMLPVLRSLTVVGNDWNNLFISPYSRPKFHAPALELLTVDLKFDASRLDRVPRLVAYIEPGRRLRQITIRLPAAFSRQSPVTAQVSVDLADTADQVLFEYAPAVRHHDYSCVWYRP